VEINLRKIESIFIDIVIVIFSLKLKFFSFFDTRIVALNNNKWKQVKCNEKNKDERFMTYILYVFLFC